MLPYSQNTATQAFAAAKKSDTTKTRRFLLSILDKSSSALDDLTEMCLSIIIHAGSDYIA